jgi:16S rRNA (cytosine1402-N4)-methyltransferase
MEYHKPVLLAETLQSLNIEPGRKYIDGTLGQAGHTIEILKKGGLVLGIDVDENSLKISQERIEKENLQKGFIGVKGNFKNIDKIASENNFGQVSGILLDLGYSSFELEEGNMGLSFLKNEPLDMRLDKTLGVTAADLVNTLPGKQLENIIRNYSNERFAKRISKAIVDFRNVKRIQTTKDLADLIKSETPPNYESGRIHPATRTFQALRIAVNDELENLRIALPRAARLLLPSGVMVIISFQSLEDKLVKDFGRSAQPIIRPLFKKPIVASKQELGINIRSRSAKLRVFISARKEETMACRLESFIKTDAK